MIDCMAIKTKSLFVTAKGEVLPCCFIYRGGPNLTPFLQKISKEQNFDSLVETWNMPHPHLTCFLTCSTESSHPLSMKDFYKQWDIKENL